MVVVFVLVAIAVIALLAGVHRYVWSRLVRDTTAGRGRARRIGTVVMWVLPLLSLGALMSGRAGAPLWLESVLAWPGYLWLAVLLYLVLALLVGEVVRAVWLRRGSPSPVEPAVAAPEPSLHTVPAGAADAPAPESGTAAPNGSPAETQAPDSRTAADEPALPAQRQVSRRLFVSRVVGGGAAAAALGTVGYGTYGVLRGPRVTRVTVPLAKLPRDAHGFRIAVVSDIHLGPVLGRAHTQRIVDTINRTSPDLVAVVGDLVDGSVADLGPAAEPSRSSRPGTAPSS